ncbi:hypothetical protein ACKKBG_A27750 [Auxenochlorella protothecoides x Auxenochlorella symbiontica]
MATWLDATAFLERGCGALHPEELVHGEDFSLYEAMLAIQIGDTKMDIGLRREQGPSLAEELASGHAPLALSLATLEQLGMQLMQAEATWHLGSMLPTTVFSSLYMLDIPRLVSNPVLHALCLSVQQSCNLVHDLLLNGHVCEDEDISIHTFGMRILGAPGTTALPQACAALRSAVEDLGSDAPGLAAHLSFRLHCLQGLERMLAANADGIDAGVAQLELALGCLEAVSAAASSDAATDTAADGSCGPRSLGFVPGINVRHMGLAPPRALAWVGARPAAAHWRGVLRALCDAARAVRAVRTWPQLRAQPAASRCIVAPGPSRLPPAPDPTPGAGHACGQGQPRDRALDAVRHADQAHDRGAAGRGLRHYPGARRAPTLVPLLGHGGRDPGPAPRQRPLRPRRPVPGAGGGGPGGVGAHRLPQPLPPAPAAPPPAGRLGQPPGPCGPGPIVPGVRRQPATGRAQGPAGAEPRRVGGERGGGLAAAAPPARLPLEPVRPRRVRHAVLVLRLPAPGAARAMGLGAGGGGGRRGSRRLPGHGGALPGRCRRRGGVHAPPSLALQHRRGRV